jgi:hypothetical protein
MSKLEELVPPLELCKLIPKGEFEDSAFIWDKTTSVGFWDGEDKDGNHIGGFGKIPHNKYRLRQNYSDRCRKHLKEQDIELDIFPAPTLQEIMVELPASNIYRIKQTWTANFINDSIDNGIKSKKPATAALKLWLELKGIEYEQAQ